MQSFNKKKIIGAVLGIVVGLIIALALPDVGITRQGMACLGVLMGAIIWWITDVLPEFVTAIIMAVLFISVCGISFGSVFSQFTKETIWLIMAAYGLGHCMRETGLMKRMASAILRLFPKSFGAQMAGTMAAGTIIGPLVPSLAAKATMLTPIVMSVSDGMGYKRDSRQALGFFQAVMAGLQTVSPTVISASAIGFALLGLLPEETTVQYDLLHWFLAALPILIITLILNSIALTIMFKPRAGKSTASSDESVSAESAEQDHQADQCEAQTIEDVPERTPMSGPEKKMAIIICLTLLFWVTEPIHGISACMVALGALACCFVFKLMDRQSFKSGIDWTSLVFIGIVLGLAAVLGEAGVIDWLTKNVGPMFAGLAQNPWLFLMAVSLATFLIRFVIVSQIASLNVLLAFIIPLAVTYGINPWCVAVAAYIAVDAWIVKYQNPVYLAAYFSINGQRPDEKKMAPFALVHSGIAFFALGVTIPIWQMFGIL